MSSRHSAPADYRAGELVMQTSVCGELGVRVTAISHSTDVTAERCPASSALSLCMRCAPPCLTPATLPPSPLSPWRTSSESYILSKHRNNSGPVRLFRLKWRRSYLSHSTELEDALQLPSDNSATLSLLDSALRRFLSLSTAYHGLFHSLTSCMRSTLLTSF